jgi:hypothetical protein
MNTVKTNADSGGLAKEFAGVELDEIGGRGAFGRLGSVDFGA